MSRMILVERSRGGSLLFGINALVLHVAKRAVFGLVHFKELELFRKIIQDFGHGRPEVIQLRDRPSTSCDMSHRQGCDAGLFLFVSNRQKRGYCECSTYLDTAYLMFHKIEQEPFGDLATTLLHALQKLRLGRLEAPTRNLLQGAA